MIGIAMYPITDAVAAFARVGAFNGEIKASSNSTGSIMIFSSVKEETKKKTSTVHAVGAALNLAPQLALRAEASRMQKVARDLSGNELSVNFYSAGLIYKF